MPCDFCAGPGRAGHRYGSMLCQRGAHALRTGKLTWNFAHIVDCALVCPECGARHTTYQAFEDCLATHGIVITWGIPRRNGAPYHGGPGGTLVSTHRGRPVVDRIALEARFLGEGAALRRCRSKRELVCGEDGLDDDLDPADVEAWVARANRYVRRSPLRALRSSPSGRLRTRFAPSGFVRGALQGGQPWVIR